MKTKLGIVGCGFLGNIVADAWKKGLLPDYELVGVTSRTRAAAGPVAEGFFSRENVRCANVSAGRTKQAFVLLSKKVLDNIRTALSE